MISVEAVILDWLILHTYPWPLRITGQGLEMFLVVTILEKNVNGI